MAESVIDRAKSKAELDKALPHIMAAPKDAGELRMIVVRAEPGKRATPDTVNISLANGVEGDHWSKGCWKSTADGAPHPDVQICLMAARTIEAIAGGPENWAPAGDNLFVDMDLTPANMPPGTRVALGSAEMVITAEPHNGCQNFIDRYGRDACLFVNTGEGKTLRLRGIYARVTKDGTIRVGDRMTKLPAGE